MSQRVLRQATQQPLEPHHVLADNHDPPRRPHRPVAAARRKKEAHPLYDHHPLFAQFGRQLFKKPCNPPSRTAPTPPSDPPTTLPSVKTSRETVPTPSTSGVGTASSYAASPTPNSLPTGYSMSTPTRHHRPRTPSSQQQGRKKKRPNTPTASPAPSPVSTGARVTTHSLLISTTAAGATSRARRPWICVPQKNGC